MLMPAIRAIIRPQTFLSTLALLVALVRADHSHHTFAADDLAVTADFFDRSRNSHFILLKLYIRYGLSTGKHARDGKIEWASTNSYWTRRHRRPGPSLSSIAKCRFEVRLFEERFVLLRHHVVLHLGHEVHGHHHNNQQ